MSPKLRILILLCLLVLPLDQLTKGWVAANIPRYGGIDVIEGFFRISHARNPGAAFGFAQGAPAWMFIGLTVAALGLIGSFYRKIPAGDRFSAVSLGLIVAGALGNLIDRVRYGEVVDFLQFDLQLFIFPDFNVADSAIVIGVGLLLLDSVLRRPSEEAREEGPDASGNAAPPGSGASPGAVP